MNDVTGLTLIFLAGSVLTYLRMARFLGRTNAPAQADEDAPDAPDPVAEVVAKQLPTSAESRKTLQDELFAAGWYGRWALTEYLAIRVVLTVAPLLVALLLALVVEPTRVAGVVFGGFVAAGLGFSMPRVVLATRTRIRNSRIERGLPVAIDLLTLSLSGGQNLLGAMEQTARELRRSHPDLADELVIVHEQTRLHSLEQAMDQWARRSKVPAVHNLAMVIVQSERLGTETGATLLELGNHLRSTMRQRAEAQANRASFWMLIPSVFCLLVAAAIILIGPAYIEFWQYRRDQMTRLNQRTRSNIQRANREAVPAESPGSLPTGQPPARPGPTATRTIE